MSKILKLFFFLFTSRWGIFLLFICAVIAGMIVAAVEKRKGKAAKEVSDLDHAVSSYSGMNHTPWHDSGDERKMGKIIKFYTGKNPKLANLRTIVYREEKMMQERAVDTAKREADEKKENDSEQNEE